MGSKLPESDVWTLTLSLNMGFDQPLLQESDSYETMLARVVQRSGCLDTILDSCFAMIDVEQGPKVFLRFEVADGAGTGDGLNDSGLLVSRFYFSTLPLPPDVLPETVDGSPEAGSLWRSVAILQHCAGRPVERDG